jgi:hypothetical protein
MVMEWKTDFQSPHLIVAAPYNEFCPARITAGQGIFVLLKKQKIRIDPVGEPSPLEVVGNRFFDLLDRG